MIHRPAVAVSPASPVESHGTGPQTRITPLQRCRAPPRGRTPVPRATVSPRGHVDRGVDEVSALDTGPGTAAAWRSQDQASGRGA